MRFRRNPRFEQQAKREHLARPAVKKAAEAVKRNGELIAQSFKDSGHYGRSFFIEETDDGYAVANDDVAGHIQEWGSADSPPRAPLRRAVRAAGLDLNESTH